MKVCDTTTRDDFSAKFASSMHEVNIVVTVQVPMYVRVYIRRFSTRLTSLHIKRTTNYYQLRFIPLQSHKTLNLKPTIFILVIVIILRDKCFRHLALDNVFLMVSTFNEVEILLLVLLSLLH